MGAAIVRLPITEHRGGGGTDLKGGYGDVRP